MQLMYHMHVLIRNLESGAKAGSDQARRSPKLAMRMSLERTGILMLPRVFGYVHPVENSTGDKGASESAESMVTVEDECGETQPARTWASSHTSSSRDPPKSVSLLLPPRWGRLYVSCLDSAHAQFKDFSS
jgi:hypothetical protein